MTRKHQLSGEFLAKAAQAASGPKFGELLPESEATPSQMIKQMKSG